MLTAQIQTDLKEAMLAKSELKVSVLRMLLSELNNAQIQKGGELDQKEEIAVVQKEVKRRREGAEGFRAGGREESALKEESELEILKSYLPEQISDSELTKVVTQAITELGATSLTSMGQVMAKVMSQIGQSAEPSRVSLEVKARLS